MATRRAEWKGGSPSSRVVFKDPDQDAQSVMLFESDRQYGPVDLQAAQRPSMQVQNELVAVSCSRLRHGRCRECVACRCRSTPGPQIRARSVVSRPVQERRGMETVLAQLRAKKDALMAVFDSVSICSFPVATEEVSGRVFLVDEPPGSVTGARRWLRAEAHHVRKSGSQEVGMQGCKDVRM